MAVYSASVNFVPAVRGSKLEIKDLRTLLDMGLLPGRQLKALIVHLVQSSVKMTAGRNLPAPVN